MNRFLIIPFMFMAIIAVISVMSGQAFTTAEQDFNESLDPDPNENDQNLFSLFGGLVSSSAVIGIVIGAAGVAIVASISLFGSGLSEFAQSLLFRGVLYFSLWALLSGFSWNLLSDNDLNGMGEYAWLGITLLYVVGFGQDVTGED